MLFWSAILGVPLLIVGLFTVLAPVRAGRALVSFAEAKYVGWILCADGWFSTAHELDVIGIEAFDRFLKAFPGELWILAAVLTPLTCAWMPKHLPTRGFSAVCMLFPASLLPALRTYDTAWRLLPVSIAYACAVWGMYAMFYPWKTEKANVFLAARPGLLRVVGAVLLLTGAACLVAATLATAGHLS